MVENDRTGMLDLLDSTPERLPYRDTVEAAERIGSRALSEELAWHRSLHNSDDPLLHDQVRGIFLDGASQAKYGLRLLDRAGIGGIENSLSLSVPFHRRFALYTRFGHTLNSTLKSGVLENLPSDDISAEAGLKVRFDKGDAGLSAGWRSAVYDFPTFGVRVVRRFTPRLEAEGNLNYSAPAEDSVPLAIGGMKDEAGLRIIHRLTGRDTIQAGYARSWLRDQARRILGSGDTWTLDVAHQFSFGYPDISARAFTGYYDYRRQGVPQGRTLSLIPENAPHDSSFFVPESFFQIGAGAGFGQGHRSGYARSWRPFASLDVTWRTTSGVGFDLGLGTRGPIFGYDSLFFNLTMSSGASATSELSGVFEMGYAYHFD
jgi:hypothetical protein